MFIFSPVMAENPKSSGSPLRRTSDPHHDEHDSATEPRDRGCDVREQELGFSCISLSWATQDLVGVRLDGGSVKIPSPKPRRIYRRRSASSKRAQWWARLVGTPRVHPINIELTILRKKFEDPQTVTAFLRPTGQSLLRERIQRKPAAP